MGLTIRAVIALLMTLIFVIPGLQAKATGHLYLGFKSWEQVIGFASWQGILMWTLVGIYMIYPLIFGAYQYIFVQRKVEEMAKRRI